MQLPAEIKSLCSKIALERTRPTQWQTAAELRADAQRVIASGTSIEAAQAWLRDLLADSLAAQARR